MQKLNWKSCSGRRISHRFCVWNSTTKIMVMCHRTVGLYYCLNCDRVVCNYLWNLGCWYCTEPIYRHHTKMPKVNKSSSP
jgi:hypothetical protein